MGQKTITKDAVAKDAPILSSKEESALGMEQRQRLAIMRDAPMELSREVSAFGMGPIKCK